MNHCAMTGDIRLTTRKNIWVVLFGRGAAISVLFAVSWCAYAADVLLSKQTLKSEGQAKYYVIAIGVNRYADAFWPTLKWPVNDATKVIDHFGTQTQYQLHKILLTNESATLDSAVAALNEVSAKARSQDTVIVYISGHGTLAQGADGDLKQFVVLHDTRKDSLLTTGLAHTELFAWLDKVRARKKLLVFATCHSGEGKSRLPPKVEQLVKSTKGNLLPLSEVSEGVLVLAAAARGEAARENDKLQGDIYTHYLLEALSVYDRNKDGMVSALEAHDYARDRTWTFTQGRQRPTAHAKFIGDADIPLYGQKTKKGLPVLEAYDESLAGFYVRVNNQEKGRLPFAFPLTPGRSYVSLYTPDSDEPFVRYKVKASAGQFVNLDTVMNFRPIGFGGSARQYYWSDDAWKKLSGSSQHTGGEFHFNYHFGNVYLGVLGELPVEKSNTIRNPIDSDVRLIGAMAVGGYTYALDHFTLGANVEMGVEKMEITLTDRSTGETLDYADNSFTYGAFLSVSYTVVSDLAVTLEAGQRWGRWQFDTIGDLDGGRAWVGLGIGYRFGWKARTLW
jgi:hypothetical protein